MNSNSVTAQSVSAQSVSAHAAPAQAVVTYQARIYVTLRPSVLDPAGAAVETGLKHLGHAGISGVRIGKYIELKLSAADEAAARQQLDQVCDQLLANPVIENYRFELESI